MKLNLLFLSVICCLIHTTTFSASNEDALSKCFNAMKQKTSIESEFTAIFPKDLSLTEADFQAKETEIYQLLSKKFIDSTVQNECLNNLNSITDIDNINVTFKRGEATFNVNIDVEKLFDYITIPTGVLVYKSNLSQNSVLKLSSIPKKQKFFSSGCSDHNIWNNLDDDAAVNVAGQQTFTEFGGSENEFFLDFAEGDNKRAFPGLVITDVTNSTEETVVIYSNYKTARTRIKTFVNALKGKQCSQQGLSAYLVSVGKASNISTSGHAGAATGIAAGGAVLAGAAAVSTIPIIGWVVGGVALAASGVLLLSPKEIGDIPEVTILDGPYAL